MKLTNLDINFTDQVQLNALMDRIDKLPELLVGENEDGELVLIGICKARIDVKTFQNNGWTRINIYYRDGTIEESYEKEHKDVELP